MAQITIDAFLVGMKYYGFRLPAGQSVPSTLVALKREPLNPHDPNAIAVYVSNSIAGHLDKKSAEILAPIMDQGANWKIESIHSPAPGRASILLKIVIEQETQAIPAPKLCAGRTSGIYLIRIGGFDEVYVGQSRDVDGRIKSHWRELNHGVHANPVMRNLWKERGGKCFGAIILEKAPADLNDHDLSVWLQNREDHWIDHYDAKVGVLNFDAPNLVLVGAERAEARQRRIIEREAAAVARAKRETIKSKLESLWEVRAAKQQRVREAEATIRSSSGIWAFLFATDKEKQRAAKLSAEVESLKAEIELLDKAHDQVREELRKLPELPAGAKRRLRKRLNDRVRGPRLAMPCIPR